MKLPKQVKADQEMMDMEQNKGALLLPRKFYNLLLLAGENGQKAQYTMFNLRYPFLRSANSRIRRELLTLLTNLINICTTDAILYQRLRALAMSRSLKINESYESNLQDKAFAVLTALLQRIEEEVQGVTGTQLASASAAMEPGTTTGIDAYVPLMTKNIVRRFPVSKVVKQLSNRRKKGKL